jgi:hypothetical protein
MRLEAAKFLRDILDAADRITNYTVDMAPGRVPVIDDMRLGLRRAEFD